MWWNVPSGPGNPSFGHFRSSWTGYCCFHGRCIRMIEGMSFRCLLSLHFGVGHRGALHETHNQGIHFWLPRGWWRFVGGSEKATRPPTLAPDKGRSEETTVTSKANNLLRLPQNSGKTPWCRETLRLLALGEVPHLRSSPPCQFVLTHGFADCPC